MNGLINFIKKHDNITMLFLLFIISSTFAFYMPLDANDALWNFSNIYKMTNGYQIYQELNVIITPLFFFIGKILFQIMGANYLTFSIYQTTMVYTFLFFMIYQLFKKIEIRKINAILYTIIISIIAIFTIIDASYNMLSMAFVVLGIIQIINKKENKNSDIIQGIIIFLIFMTKQNVGILYFIAIIIAQILINKKGKSVMKNILIQTITLFLLIGVYIFYLQVNHSLESFINYCFLGINEFSNKNIQYNIREIILNITSFTISLFAILLTYNRKVPLKQQEKNNIRILSTVSIFMIAVSYPIMNVAHTLIANVIFMILFSYFLEIFIMKELLTGRKIEIIKQAIIALLFGVSLFYYLLYHTKYWAQITDVNYYFKKESPYYGAVAKEDTLQEIEEIIEYIKEQNNQGIEVKIISCYANLYMNILQKNNQDMDLPFYGNMGKNGENGMIEELEKLRNSKILILTNEKENHKQESKKILQYIRENFELEGNISKFSIYKSN